MHILLLVPPSGEPPPHQGSTPWLRSALESLGHTIHAPEVGEHIERLIPQIKKAKPEVMLLCQESHAPLDVPGFYVALCEQLQIPVVGSPSFVWSTTHDPETARALAGTPQVSLEGEEVTLYVIERLGVCATMPLRDTLREAALQLAKGLGLRDLGSLRLKVSKQGEIDLLGVTPMPSIAQGAEIYEAASVTFGLEPKAVLQAILQSTATRHMLRSAPSQTDPLRVGLAYNLRRVDPTKDDVDAEFDSQETIFAIKQGIEAMGHDVVLLEATAKLPRLLEQTPLDVVFNIAEGIQGRSREAQVPALLELLGIPYTGSDAAALAVTLDKGLAKRVVRTSGVATASWAVLTTHSPLPTGLRFPLIVKPNAEGSSKGITSAAVARDEGELAAIVETLRQKFDSILVEEFLPGREFTVGLLEKNGELVTLPIMEVCFHKEAGALPVYSYAHKTETDKSVTLEVPAQIPPPLDRALRELAVVSFQALGCRDVGRVDIRLDAAGLPHFVECNPLPGLSPGFSDLCVAALAQGMDHRALMAAILAPALGRLAHQRHHEGSSR